MFILSSNIQWIILKKVDVMSYPQNVLYKDKFSYGFSAS